jgi:hypothetical protein
VRDRNWSLETWSGDEKCSVQRSYGLAAKKKWPWPAKIIFGFRPGKLSLPYIKFCAREVPLKLLYWA